MEWRGRVFEAAVGAHLARLGYDLYYWREGDHEVDFVLDINGTIYGIEVKSGRRCSPKGLIAFKKAFPDARCVILDWQKGEAFLRELPNLSHLF